MQKSKNATQAEAIRKEWDNLLENFNKFVVKKDKIVEDLLEDGAAQKAPDLYNQLSQDLLKLWEIFTTTTPIANPVYATGILNYTLDVTIQYETTIRQIIVQKLY